MKNLKKSIVVTTIHSPSKALKEFSKLHGWDLIAVGDLKTPKNWKVTGVEYVSPEEQEKLFPGLSKLIGWNKYARKNMGYLYAAQCGAEIIAEIDDDITPYDNFPPKISENKNIPVISGEKFVNIYTVFGSKESWPRGFPVNRVLTKQTLKKTVKKIYSPIQNSLLDQNGDFDAIYRLIFDNNVIFKKTGEYALDKGVYCPFHSGSTFWYPAAYLLLYMPSFVNPHVEDIWRGYIAQRLVWEINGHITFIYPTVYTDNRNKHNYIKDFQDELPLFLQTEKLIQVLDDLSLSKDLGKSLIKIYSALVKEGIMVKKELRSLKTWIDEMEKLL